MPKQRIKCTDLHYLQRTAILDFVPVTFYSILMHLIEFFDPKNLQIDTKIMFFMSNRTKVLTKYQNQQYAGRSSWISSF